MARGHTTKGCLIPRGFQGFALAIAYLVFQSVQSMSPSAAFKEAAIKAAEPGGIPSSAKNLRANSSSREDQYRREIGRWYGAQGAVSISGVVADTNGRAVGGATVGFGPYGLLPFQWNCKTDEAGRFRMGFMSKYVTVARNEGFIGVSATPVRVPTDSLVVGADGYAATRIPFSRAPGTYTVPIRLKKGMTVRARVVDREGHPVRNAFAVFVARVPNPPHWMVQYRTNSDDQGRFEWKGACDANVAIYVGKPGPIDGIGYHASTASARADGKERVIELRPMPGKFSFNPPVRINNICAYFVEARTSSDHQFPLYVLSLQQPELPELYGYGYFGCRSYLSFFLPLGATPHRRPDAAGDYNAWELAFQGLPEPRRAPAPLDQKNPPNSHRTDQKR